MARGRLRWGTSSWSEKSWVGPFYPPGTKPADFLSYYATRFDTVEADNTYYRVPAARVVEGWARRLPEGFTFSAKFPRSVVHAGDGPRPSGERVLAPAHVREDVELFLERMALLGDRVGPLVLQFPYFNRQAFSERAPFLERLDAFLGSLPADFRYAVELRNEKWIDPELLDLLRTHRTALVWTDLSYLPHPASLAARFDLVTTDFVYARLIGDRRKIDSLTKTFDRIILDQSPRLQAWAELLDRTAERVPEAYVYANNHFAGHGPATARELQALVEG